MQYYVKYNVTSEVQKLVVDFIRDMPENLEVLVIPINHSTDQTRMGLHWSLLNFDFEAKEWKWYNSLHSENEQSYKDDAKKLADVVQVELNKKRALKGHPPIEEHELNIMTCPSQGINPDCLIYTCYFMKRSMKTTKGMEKGQQRAEDICQQMRSKLVAKMLTKVGWYEKVWDIAKDEEHNQWRKTTGKQPLKRKKSF